MWLPPLRKEASLYSKWSPSEKSTTGHNKRSTDCGNLDPMDMFSRQSPHLRLREHRGGEGKKMVRARIPEGVL